MPRDGTALLLRLVDQAFDRRSWHGTNLRGSLRGVTPEVAAWRPQPERHNIWELVVHAAYWKYRVYRHLTDAPPRSFSLKGTDWYPRPVEQTEAAWKTDVALLTEWHGRLRDAVEAFDPQQLDAQAYKPYSVEDLIRGVAAHDLYHTGQIQLLKRMWNGRGED